MEHVSKCCGRKYTMEIIWSVILADSRIIPLQTPGMPPEETSVCCGCYEPCRTVLEGEEMKPTEGGIYCQTCARRMSRSKRVPKQFELRHPAGGGTKSPKATCWGCGRIMELSGASILVKRG